MLRFGLGAPEIAKAIESAIDKVITEGYRTKDIASAHDVKERQVGTSEMGDAIAAAI